MKRIYIASKKKFNFSKFDFNQLEEIKEKKIFLCYSIQFRELAEEVRKILGNRVVQFEQILGCSNPKLNKSVKALLLVGEGGFHSISLNYETGIKTYVFNEAGLKEVSKEEVSKLERREKGAYLNYLNSERVGILVSTKLGQNKIGRAINFKKNLKNKKGYLFIGNEINLKEFENFRLNSWINSSCPRIDLEDNRIINLTKLEDLNSRH